MRSAANLKQTNKWPYMFIAPYYLTYLIFGLFPILFTLYISFTNWTLTGDQLFIGLANYKLLLFEDTYFWKSIGNTMIYMLCYLPVLILFGMLLASIIETKWIRGKTFFRLSIFSPYLTTPVAVGIIFSLLFDWQSGILNNILTHLGLIQEKINWLGEPGLARFIIIVMVIWKNLGYFVMFYTAGMASVDPSIYEAATVDGASARQVFFHITIPLLKPMNLFLIITSIIGGLQMVEEPMLLFSGWVGGAPTVGGPDGAALTPIWYMYDSSFNGSSFQYGKGAAIAYSTFLVIALFSVLSIKWMNKEENTR